MSVMVMPAIGYTAYACDPCKLYPLDVQYQESRPECFGVNADLARRRAGFRIDVVFEVERIENRIASGRCRYFKDSCTSEYNLRDQDGDRGDSHEYCTVSKASVKLELFSRCGVGVVGQVVPLAQNRQLTAKRTEVEISIPSGDRNRLIAPYLYILYCSTCT